MSDRHIRWRGTRLVPGARQQRDFPQDRGETLVGEAEPDPAQVPAVGQPFQHPGQLPRIRPPVVTGGQHHRVGLGMHPGRVQHRQLLTAEQPPGAPLIQAQLILPGHEPVWRVLR